MEIILQEKVVNLGEIGDLVRVKPGFARNYLFPKHLAVRATEENKRIVEERRQELEKIEAEHRAAAAQRAKAFSGMSITLSAEVTGDGKLFGAIGVSQVAQALEEAGFSVERKEVILPDGNIQKTGKHTVVLRFHPDVTETIQVQVESSGEVASLTQVIAADEADDA